MAVAAPRARPLERPSKPPHRVRESPKPQARRRARPQLARSALWIGLVAALLAGIVALNVAALQLRLERGRLQSEIVQLRAKNAEIESAISSAASASRIEGAARGRLGLVPPAGTTYLEVAKPRR